MKAFFKNGILDGRFFDVEPEDELTFTRWYCDPYPAKSYSIDYKYRKYCMVNLGKPVVYYYHVVPQNSVVWISWDAAAGGGGGGRSLAELQQRFTGSCTGSSLGSLGRIFG